ncbi:MAG TPA: M28 family peptidase [Bryobacteraceae bacterium]|nr:M28 family peptidase [Bryobacteraceae bacterium]
MRKLCVLIFLGVSWGAEPAPSPEVRHALLSITANGLKADVSFLASDALEGRATPSRGLDIAAEYIAAQFRRAGLEPAGDDGYFQTAEYLSVLPNTDGMELTAELGGETFRVPEERILIQNARGVRLDRVEAVKIGPAGEVDAASVTGRLVLFEAPDLYAAFRKVRSTRELLAKAAAVIVIGNSVPDGPPRRRLTATDEANGPALMMIGDADLLRALQSALAPPLVTLKMGEPSTERVKLRNVAAIVRGTDPVLKDSYVLLSAHYDHTGLNPAGEGDHVFNGANDNASGTASVIAAAQALAQARPKRSVLFITWFGEEVGGYGARYYTRHPIVPLEKTVANVNLEQTGRTDDTRGPAVNSATLTGFDFSEVGAVFAEAGHATGVTIAKDEKRSDDYFGRSDNLTLAQAGVPAHTLCVAFEYADYHRVSDEWNKLDYGNMEKVTRAIAAGVWMLAERADAVQWNRQNPRAAQYAKLRPQAPAQTKKEAR